MTILIALIAIIFIILILPVGTLLEYSQDGVLLVVNLGPFKMQVIPEKEKKKKKEKEKKAVEKLEEIKKGGSFELFRRMSGEISDTFSAFKRKLKIDVLILHYVSASESAYNAAMNFGYAWAGIGMIIPVLENNFNIKERSLTADVSFTETEPTVYVKAKLKMTVISILSIAILHGTKLIKIYSDFEKTRKAER